MLFIYESLIIHYFQPDTALNKFITSVKHFVLMPCLVQTCMLTIYLQRPTICKQKEKRAPFTALTALQ